MRKLLKVVSVVTAVVTMGNVMSVVQANPSPPNRVPVKVEQTGRTNTVYSGPSYWGHSTIYDLKVTDNNGDHYGLGTPYEAFGGVTYSTNTTIENALQTIGVPGTPSGPNNPWALGATFQDQNATTLTWDTGVDTFWYSFPQYWHDIRVSDSHDFTLNTHTVNHFQGYVTRRY